MGAQCSSSASTERPLASTDDYLESIGRTSARPRLQTYHDLPPELLDLVIAGLPNPADRARARAVCRSWHAAVRRHGTQPWRLPSTMCPTQRHRSLFRGAGIVGSTDDWLAIQVGKEPRNFLLENPFLKMIVPLTELDAIIGHDKSIIYKFLMRSGTDDLIAVITNNRRYAFMVIRTGKGVWLPPPRTRPYIDIIDFSFLQGKLYAITRAEDLIPFDLALDGEGRPMVIMGSHLIKKSPDYNDPNEPEEQVAAALPDIAFDNCSADVWSPTGSRDNLYISSRHLIESRGKLLMVRHHQQVRRPEDGWHGAAYITRGVEVFEANPNIGDWMPVTGGLGLGGGRALFISTNFSKSVAAPCGEVEEDAIYFMGTGDVFNLKTGACSPSPCWSLGEETWLFHPELVF